MVDTQNKNRSGRAENEWVRNINRLFQLQLNLEFRAMVMNLRKDLIGYDDAPFQDVDYYETHLKKTHDRYSNILKEFLEKSGLGEFYVHGVIRILKRFRLSGGWFWTIQDMVLFNNAGPPTRNTEKQFRILGLPKSKFSQRDIKAIANRMNAYALIVGEAMELKKSYSHRLKRIGMSSLQVKTIATRNKRQTGRAIKRTYIKPKLVKQYFGSPEAYKKTVQRFKEEGYLP